MRRPTIQDRKMARQNVRNEKYGDFTADDLPEKIGGFELDYKDENGDYCEKHQESYVYFDEDDRQLEITKRVNHHQFQLMTRVNEGNLWLIDEKFGYYGYLGEAVEAAQKQFE